MPLKDYPENIQKSVAHLSLIMKGKGNFASIEERETHMKILTHYISDTVLTILLKENDNLL